jgi:hypothetical protein
MTQGPRYLNTLTVWPTMSYHGMSFKFAKLQYICSSQELFCKSPLFFFRIPDPFSRIQPAGCIHEVYTFVNTILAGGHFLCFDMMHLTEQTRAFHHSRALSVTNAEHEAVVSTLARMLLSLSICDGLGNVDLFYSYICANGEQCFLSDVFWHWFCRTLCRRSICPRQ